MFEMSPVFVVAPFTHGRRKEPFQAPRMAIVEAVLRVVDGDGYLCRLAAVPWLPMRVCEVFVRLEGVSAPEGVEPDYHDKLRAESVKDFAARSIQEAGLVTLRDFRRDKAARLLADVHVDHRDLATLLLEVVREVELGNGGPVLLAGAPAPGD